MTSAHGCANSRWICLAAAGLVHQLERGVTSMLTPSALVSAHGLYQPSHRPRWQQSCVCRLVISVLRLMLLALICQPNIRGHESPHNHHHATSIVRSCVRVEVAVLGVRPGFRGRKAILNHAHALVSACLWYVNRHPRTLSITWSWRRRMLLAWSDPKENRDENPRSKTSSSLSPPPLALELNKGLEWDTSALLWWNS